jgi:hypothetical protein
MPAVGLHFLREICHIWMLMRPGVYVCTRFNFRVNSSAGRLCLTCKIRALFRLSLMGSSRLRSFDLSHCPLSQGRIRPGEYGRLWAFLWLVLRPCFSQSLW